LTNTYCGIDLGSGFVKVVVMNRTTVLASRILPTTGTFEDIATEGLRITLAHAGITQNDLQWITITGYGNHKLSFPHRKVSPLSAGALGARYFYPTVGTVIDVGVQQSSVAKVDARGIIVDSLVSEKCAAGSGWFLKVVARVMGLTLEDLAPFSLRSANPVTITTDCAVFAETEVVARVAEGNSREDIVAGAHQALAHKVKNLVDRTGMTPACVLIGGTGKDEGFVAKLTDVLGVPIRLPQDPQLAAAIGAVLFHLE